MKKHNYFTILLVAILAMIVVTSCIDDDEEGRKVTDYKEYTLTVASVKLPGVLTSSGRNVLADVYAVKTSSPPIGRLMVASVSLNMKKAMSTKYASAERAIWIIIWAIRHGLNTSYWKSYRKNARTLKIYRLISYRTGILSNIVRISILNLPMPLMPTKRRI